MCRNTYACSSTSRRFWLTKSGWSLGIIIYLQISPGALYAQPQWRNTALCLIVEWMNAEVNWPTQIKWANFSIRWCHQDLPHSSPSTDRQMLVPVHHSVNPPKAESATIAEPFFLQHGILKNVSSKETVTVSYRAMCAERFAQVMQKGKSPGLGMEEGNTWSHKCHTVADSDHNTHTYKLSDPNSPRRPISETNKKQKGRIRGLRQHKGCHALKLKTFLHENCSSMDPKPIYSPSGQNTLNLITSKMHITVSEVVLSQPRKTINLLFSSWGVLDIMDHVHILVLATRKHRAKFLMQF